MHGSHVTSCNIAVLSRTPIKISGSPAAAGRRRYIRACIRIFAGVAIRDFVEKTKIVLYQIRVNMMLIYHLLFYVCIALHCAFLSDHD